MSEAYNTCLQDLHKIKKLEDTEFMEDQLTQVAYSLLKACSQHQFKCMLRMDMVYFTDTVRAFLLLCVNCLIVGIN